MNRRVRLAAIWVRLAEARAATADAALTRTRRQVVQAQAMVAAFAPMAGATEAGTLTARDRFARRLDDGIVALGAGLTEAEKAAARTALTVRRAEHVRDAATEAARLTAARAARRVGR